MYLTSCNRRAARGFRTPPLSRVGKPRPSLQRGFLVVDALHTVLGAVSLVIALRSAVEMDFAQGVLAKGAIVFVAALTAAVILWWRLVTRAARPCVAARRRAERKPISCWLAEGAVRDAAAQRLKTTGSMRRRTSTARTGGWV